MFSLNKTMLFGNLTRDPELVEFSSGSSLCKINIALNSSYKDKDGEKKENTTFLQLSAWGKRGESIATYMKKGDNAYFEVEIRNNNYEKEDGTKVYDYEFRVTNFQFGINPRRENQVQDETQAPAEPQAQAQQEEITVDDLPF